MDHRNSDVRLTDWLIRGGLWLYYMRVSKVPTFVSRRNPSHSLKESHDEVARTHERGDRIYKVRSHARTLTEGSIQSCSCGNVLCGPFDKRSPKS